MKAEEWGKITELLEAALDLEPARRREFCSQIGAKSPELQREIESLLACENDAEQFLASPNVAFSTALFIDEDAPDTLAGQQIGVYRVEREIGHGGMGAVYLATRADGKFSQRVALKLLKREMNTAELRRRFQQEREILASLEHPNIARLLDAGTTDDKIPYLAMEYVEGVPIDEFCSSQQLDLNQRLILFKKVCSAVNFAHRNLIVHRDLKPSNIFVTADGTPKLLDFGISKILSAEFENVSPATVTKLGALTPTYASPEQLRGESVTTATDIYSLGVILYEILSGHRPFEKQENSLKEIYHAVTEKEPPPPSYLIASISKSFKKATVAKTVVKNENVADLSTIVQNFDSRTESNKFQNTAPNKINLSSNSLRGDLDNIVLKALRKEPERRYSSAENFSEDIRRHQKGLPVTARPNTFSYRAEKFIARHQFGVFAAFLIALSLIGGISATVWQARRAEQQKFIAQQRFDEARKVANSLLFEVYPQIENLQGATAAKETVVKRALEYLDNLAAQSAGDAALQRELAAAYEKVGDVQGMPNQPNLGDLKGALASYQKARNLRESLVASDKQNPVLRDELATNYENQGVILWWLSETPRAVALYEKALPVRRALVAENPQSVVYQTHLASLQMDWGDVPAWNNKPEEALRHLGEARTILENLLTENPNDTHLKTVLALCLIRVGTSQQNTEDYDGAEQSFAKAQAVYTPLAAANPNNYKYLRGLWEVKFGQCEMYVEKPDAQNALENCLQLKNMAENLSRKDKDTFTQHDLQSSHSYAGEAYLLTGEPQKAIDEFEKSRSLDEQLIAAAPDDDENKRSLANAELDLGKADFQLGNFESALAHQQKARATLEEIVNDDAGNLIPQIDLANVLKQIGEINLKQKNLPEARKMFSLAFDILQKLDAENSLNVYNKKMLSELENKIASLKMK